MKKHTTCFDFPLPQAPIHLFHVGISFGLVLGKNFHFNFTPNRK